MILNKLMNVAVFCLTVGFLSCNSKPKVIESETKAATAVSANSIPALEKLPPLKDAPNVEHQVVVQEILETEKYSYLLVTEKEEKFWVAISKRAVTVGDTYYYKGGLLKKNFYSKEFDKVFDTVYLVSNIWKKTDSGDIASTMESAPSHVHSGETLPDLKVGKIELAEGATSLKELFDNKNQFQNQTIKITGKIVKVNPMIMSRNWLHIQDGSGEGLDLTVTTTENVPLGAIVSIEGTIALDKDFGAGYRYDIIMEGAVLK